MGTVVAAESLRVRPEKSKRAGMLVVANLKRRGRFISCSKQVVAGDHYRPFKHSISFATYLAANFGCYQLRIMTDIVLKLLPSK